MKEFSDLRKETLEEVSIPHTSMPPNILILRRKTVRQFPGQTMVALYYNNILDQYFSIPFGTPNDSVVTPMTVAEETSQEAEIKRHEQQSKLWANRRKRWDAYKKDQQKQREDVHKSYEQHHKQEQAVRHSKVKEELTEGAISHLRRVTSFETSSALRHKDGTQTKVDPTTAKALLTVHDALKPEHQTKFADMLEKSRPHFHKMVDFAWKQVH